MKSAIDLAKLTDQQLKNIIQNHRRKGMTADSVYVDYLQNIIGKTVAGVYAVRAVDGAHVSTPLDWDELTDTLTPGMFTIKTLPERLAKRGDLWAEHMARRNTAAALRKLTG